MAHKKPVSTSPKTPQAKTVAVTPALPKINYWLLAGILAMTLVLYWPSLSNQLTNWDDQEYITNNKDLADDSFEKHFSERTEVMGHYHPLTMLTLAWDYQNAVNEKGLIDPVPFHRTNLWLHVLSSALVYLLIFRLCKSNLVAAFTSAVFALHPMHVESVAWASERKDVLFAFFYLAALLSWVFFIDKKQKTLAYIVTFVLFVLSLLSKSAAASLPLVLWAIDYYRGRKFDWKVLAEKVPFLILSVVFGLLAIKSQNQFEAMSGNATYTLMDRVLFACYGTMQYVLKFFVPANLSCFYAYPSPAFPKSVLYYIAPFFVLVLLAVFVWQRKNKTVVFGLLFFALTLIMVLQIVSVGGAVMADRYTYLPYIGIAFMLGVGMDQVLKKQWVSKQLALFVPVTFVLLMAIFAYQRTEVWHDSVRLWADAESKDQTSPKIYSNFGDACNIAGNYTRAVELLSKAIQLNDQYPDAYYNRGLAYYYLKNYPASIADYSKAIALKPDLKQAWHNRAGDYFTVGKFKEALADALQAQKLGYPVDPMFLKVLREQVQKNP